MTTEEDLAFLMRDGRRWVNALRAKHRPEARRLEERELRALEGFFAPAVLDEVRVREVTAIENPSFFSVFEQAGRPAPIDFSRARAMALRDTVIFVGSRAGPGRDDWLELLFHELVHSVQFAVLGEEGYYREYVGGWAEAGERYRGIPIEEQAYDLAARFAADPETRFPVKDEIRRRFADPL